MDTGQPKLHHGSIMPRYDADSGIGYSWLLYNGEATLREDRKHLRNITDNSWDFFEYFAVVLGVLEQLQGNIICLYFVVVRLQST